MRMASPSTSPRRSRWSAAAPWTALASRRPWRSSDSAGAPRRTRGGVRDRAHREGYLVLDAITTQEEVVRLRAVYDRLFAARAGREAGDQFDLAGTDAEGQPAALPQILGPSKYAPELKEGLFRVNALAIARQLLGPEVQPRGEHAIFKPAGRGAPTPWHQDEAYWDPALDYESLSIWIPLQPATLENGCMQ